MSILIRDAVEGDVEGIARVHVQGWRESYRDFLRPEALAGLSVEERMQMWQGAFAQPDPRAKLLVAQTDDGGIVGFVRGGPIREGAEQLGTEAEIFAIYLLDKVKRRGIGLRLMRGVLDHLGRHGFRSVGLWVLKDNLSARRFYEALGGQSGAEQSFDLRGQMVVEVAYRFDLTPGMDRAAPMMDPRPLR
ncbi:GNAT family N-acetyltransferase [Microvirga lotononidis]|uniref:Sortase-like acyltransferase n=1 Tax=Microvirga lotononidis TaxID=864069 RepID=I4YPD3_9HYPH|nr:GNAT family N-acetyltransferase [Microvirga lotononidis]EIM25825.1 sortase-like acyltransferase [Microvirga lotononidis]WQO25745.1 GNAT family N-acetyltransferase [Microvirga lotononidis]